MILGLFCISFCMDWDLDILCCLYVGFLNLYMKEKKGELVIKGVIFLVLYGINLSLLI